MSDLWAYCPSVCDGHFCPQDCDHCGYADKMLEQMDEWCKICHYSHIDYCDSCFACCDAEDGKPTQFVPMSHREQLRYMTDEELAEWFCRSCIAVRAEAIPDFPRTNEPNEARWYKWLKMEVEHG